MESGDKSEFEYFAEGDTLSGWDPIGDEVGKMNEVNNIDATFHAEENMIQSDPKYLTEPSDSDDELGQRFPMFDEKIDMKSPKLEVGLIFPSVDIYRKALRQSAVQRGIALKFEKNEKTRVTACCKNDCGWRIHASVMTKSTAYQIKSLRGEPHKCPRAFRNKLANSAYLAECYIDKFTQDPICL